MRTLFLLGIALITLLLSNSLMISPYTQNKETQKPIVKVSEEDWGNLHLMIERSPIDNVKENFELFVKKNVLQTTAINSKNGKYFGITPADDYGYFHVVFLEIHQGKIINIHYDELKPNGKNKRTDLGYNTEMLKTGTSPSIAYPIYENELIRNQDYMNIDAVTGATYSLYRFRMAVAKAFEKAIVN
jgi:major membrane immunogen (membrane-anchored lipoprotein)